MLQKIREHFLKKRLNKFFNAFPNMDGKSILDLGGYDGWYMDFIKRACPNLKITIADHDKNGLDIARKKGYDIVLLDGAKKLPFENNQFDIVFCNSVIEHVTTPKDEIWNLTSGIEFKKRSFIIQKHFANEIMRISKSYFVQTPNKKFFLEHHTWLPFIQFIPRKTLVKVLRFTNKFWIKKTAPDWNLLTGVEIQEMFSDAKILKEKFIFMNKSLIAYRK